MSTRGALNQASPTQTEVATVRPADLKQWIDALPYANRGAVLESLGHELSRLGAVEIKPSLRYELLELHAGAYVRLLSSLIQQRGSGGASALKHHRAFAEMARKVTLHLADGYQSIVDGAASKKGALFGKRRSDIPAIQRAMLFLCYALNHHYDQYLPTEPRVWIGLARLYEVARERGALDRAGSRGDLRVEFGKSVSHLYKRALLTGLADPYHHGPGEVWTMFDLLGECADTAEFTPDPPSSGPEGVFVIDPSGEERAWPLSFDTGGDTGQRRYLNTSSTCALLQKMRDQTEQGEREEFRSPRAKRQAVSILNRMIRSLKEPGQRSNDRKPIAAPVQLAVGISATQQLIGGRVIGGAQATFTGGKEVVPKGVEPQDDDVSVMKMIDPRSGGTVDVGVDVGKRKGGTADGEGGASNGSEEAGVSAVYGTESWNVTNKSRRGIGITRSDPPHNPPCVGEIVSFSTKKNTSAIGLVRWFTVDESGIYRAGIEIIGKRADSISIRAVEDASNTGAARPALAMPFFGADEKVATLVALPGTFREQGRLIVQSAESETQVTVQMDSLVDATPSCERFTYRFTKGSR